jgi:hypothetical protein
MLTSNYSTTVRRSEQATDLTHPPANRLVSMWARGRRQITPWAYPRLYALAAVRFTVGIFLVGVGALTISDRHAGWAAIALGGAALLLSIASLDYTVARSAPRS